MFLVHVFPKKKKSVITTLPHPPMDTSTGEKYALLYPTKARRTVTEIKPNVRKSEIKISTVFVTVPLFLFGDACTPCRHWRRWKKEL